MTNELAGYKLVLLHSYSLSVAPLLLTHSGALQMEIQSSCTEYNVPRASTQRDGQLWGRDRGNCSSILAFSACVLILMASRVQEAPRELTA